jgi:hypothetical protein
MMGWHISVYRQPDGGHSSATSESPAGTRLAVWQTDAYGLQWLHELAKAGNAIYLGGDGYPVCFTATAEYILPRILDQPPMARDTWIIGEGTVDPDVWVGKTLIDRDAARQCRFDEWLEIVAWDES